MIPKGERAIARQQNFRQREVIAIRSKFENSWRAGRELIIQGAWLNPGLYRPHRDSSARK